AVISGHHAALTRRLLILAAALIATLGAHAVTGDELRLVPAAPLIWGSMAALVVLTCRRDPGPWRRRPAAEILLRLVALQVVLHVAMTAAPWAFGLGVHHRPELLGVAALIAHGGAAVVLTVLLAHAERLLLAAQGVARAVRRALAPMASARRHRPTARIEARRVPRGPRLAGAWARGPPAAAA
ncbi:MAG: hypothetical protein JHC74_08570, partial [Thermoleophilia bacterium]|nr:hypothetical protein [Thermoleophilia bacterium]